MKKYLIIAIALFISINFAKAQHANIGIKGGASLYNIQASNGTNYEPIFSFYVGLLSHFHMSGQFALQPEIYYSGQGTQYKANDENLHLQLNYINVPVLLQYMFDNGFRLQAGPQLGVLMSADTELGNNAANEVKSSFKSTDIGLVVGISYVKPSTGLGYDIRYNYGLTNIDDTNTSNTYNRGFQVGLFYLFKHRN